MKYILFVFLYCLLLASCTGCGTLPNGEEYPIREHACGDDIIIAWPYNSSIALRIHEDVPNEFMYDIETAVYLWNWVIGYEFFKLQIDYRDTSDLIDIPDGVNTIYVGEPLASDDEYFFGPNNKRSVARNVRRYIKKNIIFETDIYINTGDYTFELDTIHSDIAIHHTEGKHGISLRGTLLHELGHALGLEHVPDTKSTMHATVWPYMVYIDYESEQKVKCLYSREVQ